MTDASQPSDAAQIFDNFVTQPHFAEEESRHNFSLVLDYLRRRCYGRELEDYEVKRAASMIAGALLLGASRVRTVYLSLDELHRRPPPSLESLESCAWRLAVNRSVLSSGQICPADPEAFLKHIALANISRVTANDALRKKQKIRLDFNVLTGPLAGKTLSKVVSTRLAKVLYRRLCGKQAAKKFPTPKLFLGLRAAIEVEKTSRGDIRVDQIFPTKQARKLNTALARSRFRSSSPCPLNRAEDCYLCPVLRSRCNRSVRIAEGKKP